MANDAIPYYEPGDRITAAVSAAVLGKRFVQISGGRSSHGNITVSQAVAGADVFGVAGFDADPADDSKPDRTTILRETEVVPVVAGAAITAGDPITSDANGEAAVATGAAGDVVHAVGIALDDAATGEDAQVALSPFSFTAA